jgi:phosphoribosylformimino-5-aminoimidazole carboxamide ribotide isomerase
MTIFPAIDLKDGKAVRLTKGLMDSAKIYSNEPYKLAEKFQEAGAKWLHIVDLNGAFAGEPKNLEQIKKIREHTDLKIQLGGGIRDEQTIKNYLKLGINRLILGSIAAKNPDFVKKMAKKYPIVVGIDAIDGFVAVEGWAQKSTLKATDLAKAYADAGAEAIICTDISKDGTLSGVNIDFTVQIAKNCKISTIASGGIKDINDIIMLGKNKIIDGAIIGKAYYEGKIDIKEVFKLN